MPRTVRKTDGKSDKREHPGLRPPPLPSNARAGGKSASKQDGPTDAQRASLRALAKEDPRAIASWLEDAIAHRWHTWEATS